MKASKVLRACVRNQLRLEPARGPGAVSPGGETSLLADVAMRESLPDRASVLELCGPAHAGIAAARAHRATLTVVDVARRTMLRTIVSECFTACVCALAAASCSTLSPANAST